MASSRNTSSTTLPLLSPRREESHSHTLPPPARPPRQKSGSRFDPHSLPRKFAPSDDPQETAADRGWHIVSTPHYQELCEAIGNNDAGKLRHIISKPEEGSKKSLLRERIPVELHSPAGHLMYTRAATLGHLLACFASANTLQQLYDWQLITPSQFFHRIDWEVKLKYFDKDSDALVRAWKSVPCSHMCAIRDNEEVYLWFISNGFIRRQQETDGAAENILHICIHEEAYKMTSRIVGDKNLYRTDVLRDIFCRKDTKMNLTPLMKAATRQDPVMLITFLRAAPSEYLLGNEDITGLSMNIYCFLFEFVDEPRIIVELVKDLLRRKIHPEQSIQEYHSGKRILPAAIECCNLSQSDLQMVLNLLCLNGSQVRPDAMVSVLNSTMTDDEILSTARILLKYGEPVNILKGSTSEVSIETSPKNAVLQMIKNIYIKSDLINKLLVLFGEYASPELYFPRTREMADCLAETCFLLNDKIDLHIAFGGPLRIFLEYMEAFDTSIKSQRYRDRFLDWILEAIFKCYPHSLTEIHDVYVENKFISKVSACFAILTGMEIFDFNTLVNGRIMMSHIFSGNVPAKAICRVIKLLPKKVNLNARDASGRRIGHDFIDGFSEDMKVILHGLKLMRLQGLKVEKSDFNRENLLMYYLKKCVPHVPNQDKLSAAASKAAKIRETYFFKVFHFLIDCGINAHHSISKEDNGEKENILSIAMEQDCPILVREILSHFPTILKTVPPVSLLQYIRQKPGFVDYITRKRKAVVEHAPPPANGSADGEHAPTPPKESMTLRDLWKNYIKAKHMEIMETLEEDPSYSVEVQIIYDFFVTNKCDLKRKLMSHTSMDVGVFFRKVKDDVETKESKLMNAELLNRVVEYEDLKEHPIVTEHLESFYFRAFLISTFFTLCHISFLVLLCGYADGVITGRGPFHRFHLIDNQRDGNGHFDCAVNMCDVSAANRDNVLLKTHEDDGPNNCTAIVINGTTCQACYAHVQNGSMCLNQTGFSIRKSECPQTRAQASVWVNPLQFVLVALCIIQLLKELFQLLTNWRDYLRGDLLENACEIIMYICTLLFVINLTNCNWNQGMKEVWQYEIGTIAILCGWFMMFAYLTRFPGIGTYVIMFYETVQTLVWVFISFSAVFLGFVFSLHLLMSHKYPFASVQSSFMKTFAMMMGELDFNAMFATHFDDSSGLMTNSEKEPWKNVYHENLLRVVVLLFCLLISIVLMNLLVGLTVGDVEKVGREAEMTKWQRCIDFAVESDITVLRFMRIFHNMTSCCHRKNKSSTDVENNYRGGGGLFNAKTESYREINFRGRNILKMAGIAKIFGFVNGNTLKDRLMQLERRKRKVIEDSRSGVLGHTDYFHERDSDDEEDLSKLQALSNRRLSEEMRLSDSDSERYTVHGDGDDDEIDILAVPEDCGPSEETTLDKTQVVFRTRHDRHSDAVKLQLSEHIHDSSSTSHGHGHGHGHSH